MEKKIGSINLKLIKGDLTDADCDAIVNAANSFLKHGGGVAYAIVKKGGYSIQKESDEFVKKHGPLKRGEVALTSGGNLKARYVIHTVGPIYGEGSFEDLVLAYRSALEKALELKLKCIAFPAISTGAYGFPYEDSAKAFFDALKDFKGDSLREIRVYLFNDEAYDVFKRVFETRYLL
ncbi:MAG: macro domain-containing protein [Nitrososphaeria archaeon]